MIVRGPKERNAVTDNRNKLVAMMGTGLWCIAGWSEHGLGLRCSELVHVGDGDGHGSWIRVEAGLVVTLTSPTISRV